MKRFSVLALLGLAIGAMALTAGCAVIRRGPDSPRESSAAPTGAWSARASARATWARRSITAAFDAAQTKRLLRSQPVHRPLHRRARAGSFKAGPLAGTLMAGPEPLMAAESAYLKLLEGCDSYKVEGARSRSRPAGTRA